MPACGPASGPAARAAEIVVVGVNHRSASGALRELLATEERELPALDRRLRAAGIGQYLWLSTCDRVEMHAAHDDPVAVLSTTAGLFAERAGLSPASIEPQLYLLTGRAALRHVFAVACSLDSQVVGEPHVLGQVKAAQRFAATAGTLGRELDAVLQAAYGAAKRVRSETAIAERPVSIAAAAVQTARDLHGDLERCAGLLLGTGDMGELMVESLRDAGLGRLVVSASSDVRGEAMARRLGSSFVPSAGLDGALATSDIVVTASGLGRYTLDAGRVAAALRQRRNRPIFVIDTSAPADVDPAAAGLEHVFVYDLADLERVATAGRVGREAAAGAAWAIVDEAVDAFLRDRAERAAVPAVAALRRYFEAERGRLLTEQAGLDAEAATRLLINRLLHRPSEVLRGMAADGDPAAANAERLLGQLFRAGDAGCGEPDCGAEPDCDESEER